MNKLRILRGIALLVTTAALLGLLLWLQSQMVGAQHAQVEIPVIPPELLRQLEAESNARTAGENCEIFGNASSAMGSELTAGESLTVTFTHIACGGAVVTDFHGGAMLTGVTDPGKVCYALSDELTASVCMLSGTQVVTNTASVVKTGPLHVSISELSRKAPTLWEAFWQVLEEVYSLFLPLVTR